MSPARRGAGAVIAAVLALAPFAARSAPAPGASPPPRGATAAGGTTGEQAALTALREMSDALASARTLRFELRVLAPLKAPSGDWVTLVGSARVMREGKDRLFVETGGDLFPFRFYFDGKTVTAYAPQQNVYAQREAHGTIGEVLAQAEKRGEMAFVFADLVSPDPYAAMTAGLRKASVVGTSTVDGVPTQHVAVHGARMDWEVWIGTEDRLPRMVALTDTAEARKPTHTLELSGWARDQELPDSTFAFAAPSGATRVPFRDPGQAGAAGRRPPAPKRP